MNTNELKGIQVKINSDSRANKYLNHEQVRRLEREMSESFMGITRASNGAELMTAFEAFINTAVDAENLITSNAILVDETYKATSLAGAASLAQFSSIVVKADALPVPTSPTGVGIMPLSNVMRATRMASLLGALTGGAQPLKDEDLIQASLNLLTSKANAELIGAIVFSHRMDADEPPQFRGKNLEEDEEYQKWAEPISTLVIEAVAFDKGGEERRVTREYKLNSEEGVWVQLPPEQVKPEPHWTLESVKNPFAVEGGPSRMLAEMLGVDPDEFASDDEDEDANTHQTHVDGMPTRWGGSKGSIKA